MSASSANSNSLSYDKFLNLFPASPRKKYGDGYYVLCPAHPDHDPSLLIQPSANPDFTVNFKCFSGCSREDILKSKNLTRDNILVNLNEHKPTQMDRTIHPQKLVDKISYVDAIGQEIYIKQRWQSDLPKDKKFLFMHIEKGHYVPGIGNHEHVFYRYAELLQWISHKDTIRITGGERKADLLISWDLPATSKDCGEGPGKWKPEDSERLKGLDVIIYQDNDETGHKYTQDILNTLAKSAKSIKIIVFKDLQPSADILDWVKIGHTREELLQIEAGTPEESCRPVIVVNDRQLRSKIESIYKAIVNANQKEQQIYHFGGKLARIANLSTLESVSIEGLNRSMLQVYSSSNADFFRETVSKEGTEYTAVDPPEALMEAVLNLPDFPEIPELKGITRTPIMRPDGSLHSQPGYDSLTRYYYHSVEKDTLQIPDKPTLEQAVAAVNRVLDLLCDFPFKDSASKINCLALFFTSVLRNLVDDLVQIALFSKNSRGVGARLLIDINSIISTGEKGAGLSFCREEAELEKRFHAKFLSGDQHIDIDNIERQFSSQVISQIATQSIIEIRELGTHRMFRVKNRSVITANGINVEVGGDTQRRCYYIKIDSKVPRPWLKDPAGYKYPDLIDHVATHRFEILSDIFTVGRYWIQSSKPKPKNLSLGMFQQWVNTIGGMFELVGLSGFLANNEELYESADIETRQWENFIDAWYEQFNPLDPERSTPDHPVYQGELAVTVADLVAKLKSDPDFMATLPNSIDKKEEQLNKSLGNQISRRKCTRFVNGLTIIETGEKKHAKLWKVVNYQNGELEKPLSDLEKTKMANSQLNSPYNSPPRSDKNKANNDDSGRPGELGESLSNLDRTDRRKNGKNDIKVTIVETNSPNSPLVSNHDGELGSGNGELAKLTHQETLLNELLDLWNRLGRPIIHLGAGENCEDLEKLLSRTINERQRSALLVWYQKHRSNQLDCMRLTAN